MTTTITHKHEWDMGHRLPFHKGKCARLHGHRYVTEIDITGPVQTEGSMSGMVLDFYVIKDIVRDTIGHWDHRTMLWAQDRFTVEHRDEKSMTEEDYGIFRVPFMPTAENIALNMQLVIQLSLDRYESCRCTRVRVYETPNGWAEVTQ